MAPSTFVLSRVFIPILRGFLFFAQSLTMPLTTARNMLAGTIAGISKHLKVARHLSMTRVLTLFVYMFQWVIYKYFRLLSNVTKSTVDTL